MPQPPGWPSTLALSAAQTPLGAPVLLTWVDDISLGFNIGGGYSTITVPSQARQFWLDEADTAEGVAIMPAATAANTGFAATGFSAEWQLSYVGNSGEACYSYGYNLLGSNLVYDGENTPGGGPPIDFVPAGAIVIFAPPPAPPSVPASDIMRTGSAWLEGIRQASASSALVYQRGGPSGPSFNIPDATIGARSEEVVTEDGIGVILRHREYIFAVADFAVPSSSISFPPISGDHIIELNGVVWEVMGMPGGGFYRWHDMNETAIRVNVNRISA